MFPTLRLFHRIPCPDHQPSISICSRIPCLFSHLSNQNILSDASKPSLATTDVSRLVSDPVSSNPQSLSKPGPLLHLRPPVKPAPLASSSKPPVKRPRAATKPAASSSSSTVYEPSPASLQPPRIQLTISSISHTAIPTRQKLLESLYAEYLALYGAMFGLPDPLARSLAHRDSIAEEADCLRQSHKSTYRNTVIARVVAVRRRAGRKDDWAELTPDERVALLTGTMETYERLRRDRERLAARATLLSDPSKVERYVLSAAKRRTLDYVLEAPEPGELSGGQETCERCGRPFVVSHATELLPGEGEECEFHWGKPVVEIVDGLKQRIFTCCNASLDVGASDGRGCTKGRHVFVDKSTAKLHARSPFVRLPAECPPGSTPVMLAAVDCELVYTTAGLTIGRVTMVVPDGAGSRTLLDEHVLVPDSVSIIDLNTRYSGIQSIADLRPGPASKARFELAGIREEVARLGVSQQTILCGHGLENDLKALRLLHDRCIDTVDLFPHPRGLPLRMSLKKLASIFLNKVIQQSASAEEDEGSTGLVVGHDSLEDAVVALELMRYKLENEKV